MAAPTSPDNANGALKNSEVFLFGLSGRLWPLHLKPKPDELLSSWLIRFAHAHAIKAETACTMLFKRYSPIWNRDIDRLAPDYLIEGLCRVTGATLEQAWDTTLASYESWLSETVNRCGGSRWIVPLGIYHRTRTRPGLMFCPQCLAEAGGKYFRRKWRLAWSTVCTRHRCLLMDQCHSCGSSIEPHRSDMISRQALPTENTLVSCHRCSTLLLHAKSTPAEKSLVSFQIELEDTLDAGYLDWGSNPSLYSILYFNGLRFILAGIMTGRAAMNVDEQIAAVKGKEFEHCSLPERRALMQELGCLITNWPKEFNSYALKHRIRYSDLHAVAVSPPFWYAKVLSDMARGVLPLTEDEAYSIYDAAWRLGMPTSGNALRRLSGRNVSAVLVQKKPKRISDDEYEQFVVDIDHRIAGTLNKRKRLLYLRTKFMFAAVRQFNLTRKQVVKLTLDDVQRRVSDIPNASFYTEPRTERDAAAWMMWYWENIRPQLGPRQGERAIFTAYGTGRSMTAEGAGVWFK